MQQINTGTNLHPDLPNQLKKYIEEHTKILIQVFIPALATISIKLIVQISTHRNALMITAISNISNHLSNHNNLELLLSPFILANINRHINPKVVMDSLQMLIVSK